MSRLAWFESDIIHHWISFQPLFDGWKKWLKLFCSFFIRNIQLNVAFELFNITTLQNFWNIFDDEICAPSQNSFRKLQFQQETHFQSTKNTKKFIWENNSRYNCIFLNPELNNNFSLLHHQKGSLRNFRHLRILFSFDGHCWCWQFTMASRISYEAFNQK